MPCYRQPPAVDVGAQIEHHTPAGSGQRAWERPADATAEAGAAETATKPAAAVSGVQCYLTFVDASHGSLFFHWSDEPVEGALASYLPSAPVPKFKLTSNGGR